MAKDFTNITAGKVKSTIAAATQDTQEIQETPGTQEEPKKTRKNKPRKEYTEQEAAAYANSLRTAGRKGIHLQRLNLALPPELFDYVKTMSKAAGLTYAEFIGAILRDHKEAHADTYKQIIDIRKSL